MSSSSVGLIIMPRFGFDPTGFMSPRGEGDGGPDNLLNQAIEDRDIAKIRELLRHNNRLVLGEGETLTEDLPLIKAVKTGDFRVVLAVYGHYPSREVSELETKEAHRVLALKELTKLEKRSACLFWPKLDTKGIRDIIGKPIEI